MSKTVCIHSHFQVQFYNLIFYMYLYLTLIGGGAFGNERPWILNAINRSLNLYKHAGLDVIIVSYGHSAEQQKDRTGRFAASQVRERQKE